MSWECDEASARVIIGRSERGLHELTPCQTAQKSSGVYTTTRNRLAKKSAVNFCVRLFFLKVLEEELKPLFERLLALDRICVRVARSCSSRRGPGQDIYSCAVTCQNLSNRHPYLSPRQPKHIS